MIKLLNLNRIISSENKKNNSKVTMNIYITFKKTILLLYSLTEYNIKSLTNVDKFSKYKVMGVQGN